MSPAVTLAAWIAGRAPLQSERMTHLKLQKLAFYCYGAALCEDAAQLLGPIEFQAWKHGPVCPEIYDAYQAYGREPIPTPGDVPVLDPRVSTPMADALNVYGRMTAWQLREESHLEEPWHQRWDGSLNIAIPESELRAHFRRKFAGEHVKFPERLFGGSSLQLDRIPLPTFRSLHEMSTAVSQILGEA